MKSQLQEIGMHYGTDKSRNNHKGITYLEKYDKYIAKRAGQKLNLLEFGILNGQSLLTWHDYLIFSNIIGVDIDPRCASFIKDRIDVYIGSQDSIDICNKIKNKYGTVDIIIDDAAHINELILKSFELYWPLLGNNGIYIIEDLPICWGDMSEYSKSWPGMEYNRSDLQLDNVQIDIDKFIIDKIKDIQHNPNTDIYSIDFTLGSMIFTKKI